MTATLTVRLERPSRPVPVATPGRVPRIVRLLAFAHKVEADIRAGVYDDLADAARKLGLTRARVTQIANLTLLAPAIQEEILAMPATTRGRETVMERTLRPIVARSVWERQRVLLGRLEATDRNTRDFDLYQN